METNAVEHEGKVEMEKEEENEKELKKRKGVMIVGIDESEECMYALEWALNHLFLPYVPNHPFDFVLVHALPTASHAIGLAGPVAAEISPYVDSDLKNIATRVKEKALELCRSKSLNDVTVETVDGDARKVLCDAVEKYNASMLVVGSRGHGAIKSCHFNNRAVLGSVSDYCAHHAHCSVIIVKKPKTKN